MYMGYTWGAGWVGQDNASFFWFFIFVNEKQTQKPTNATLCNAKKEKPRMQN